MTIEQLREKRDQTAADRLAFVDQANRQIAAFDGALAMLDQLIETMETDDVEQNDSGSGAD